MPDNLSRSVYDALLPDNGSLWQLKQDGDFDKLLDGMSDNAELVTLFLQCISCVRDPFTTPILSDLEKEYGIQTDERLSEETRREQLAALVYTGTTNGSKDGLQSALNAAGFDVQVHENSPAVDSDLFLNSVPFMVADGDNAYAGFYPVTPGVYTSIAGKTGGDLLVNGKLFTQRPDYISVANGSTMFAGNANAYAGKYDDLVQDIIIYPIPDDPNSWPFFFFVGGDATRGVSGELTSIATADIPIERKVAFERIILKYKPLHSWAGLIINYT